MHELNAHCPMRIAHCPLPIAHCSLPMIARCAWTKKPLQRRIAVRSVSCEPGLLSEGGEDFLCIVFVSSVRSSNSHPNLLVIQHPTHFFRSHRSSTLDFHFLSHYSYIKAIMLYKDNHWTRCAGFMDASWVRLGITNDDLGTSWALPGDNLGMTWG